MIHFMTCQACVKQQKTRSSSRIWFIASRMPRIYCLLHSLVAWSHRSHRASKLSLELEKLGDGHRLCKCSNELLRPCMFLDLADVFIWSPLPPSTSLPAIRRNLSPAGEHAEQLGLLISACFLFSLQSPRQPSSAVQDPADA